jgi:TPR repeat protein
LLLLGLFAAAGATCAADSVKPEESTADASIPIDQLRRDAEQGNCKAEYLLGCCFNGEYGFPVDYAQAAKWWGKAAAGGLADAQFCIGLCYSLGQGVPKDASVASKWWTLAAEQDQAEAQYFLGLSYSVGLGVAKSSAQAIVWLNKAAKNGNGAALAVLKKLASSPG